ncbi:MAG TPA: hypothetical protein EYP82_05460 [Hydrogenothermaceae bacterium]|nr:hypothetical protein [Hydrogenothermaceae bacterium]
MRRVVITGLGAITPIGNNVNDFWNNLINGVSGIDVIKRFDPYTYKLPVVISGEVKNIDYTKHLDKKDVKRMSDFVKFAVGSSSKIILVS